MLVKPFAVMDSNDWDRAPHNTNALEHANFTAKPGGQKLNLNLYAAMQSIYEIDKTFALQYVASEAGTR